LNFYTAHAEMVLFCIGIEQIETPRQNMGADRCICWLKCLRTDTC